VKINGKDIEFERLLMRVRRCDAMAQRKLYDLLVLKMYNTALRILKNKEDTQDCLQNGFSLIFKNIEQYDDKKGTFITWSTRIMINESLRILRKKKIYFEDVSENHSVASKSVSPLDDLQLEDIIKLINALPDQMRVIFNLYEIEGYTHKEIGQMLGVAESSSRTFLMRAKKKLRSLLETTTNENFNIQTNMKS